MWICLAEFQVEEIEENYTEILYLHEWDSLILESAHWGENSSWTIRCISFELTYLSPLDDASKLEYYLMSMVSPKLQRPVDIEVEVETLTQGSGQSFPEGKSSFMEGLSSTPVIAQMAKEKMVNRSREKNIQITY